MGSKVQLEYATLDVFTKERYSGNQLAIISVPTYVTLSQYQKQKIAQEFNYSEIVFLLDTEHKEKFLHRDIGIFLRHAEIPFAGHPTIGTACFLGCQYVAREGNNGEEVQGVLNTKAGPVPFTYRPELQTAELDSPHDVHVHSYSFTPTDLTSHGFSQQVATAAPSMLPFVSIVKGVTFCVIKLPSIDALGAACAPASRPQVDDRLHTLWHPKGASIGYMFYVDEGIEIGSDGEVRLLRTRMIAAAFEDAATGSASGALAAYLALHDPNRSKDAPGPWRFEMTQGVEMGRKSMIGVEVTGEQATSRVDIVRLKGSAVHVMEGSLVVPE